MRKPADWINNPEHQKLVEFLVEKTREGKEVLSVRALSREFKITTNSTITVGGLESRICRFRQVVHEMPNLDSDTKVKLLFALSTRINYELLEKLEEEAEVTVDDFSRIVHYKKNGGGLELSGVHSTQQPELSNVQILEFLAKKVEETSKMIKLSTLAKDLKTEMGSSHHEMHLQARIRQATKQIYESVLFDEDMKVRIIFATSTVIEDYVLKELQENADVVVDSNNRIIEYQKKDGSMYLKGEKKRGRRSTTVNKSNYVEDSDEEEEWIFNDSDEEGTSMNRTGRLSDRSFLNTSLLKNQDRTISSSVRRAEFKRSNFNTPTTSNNKRKTSDITPGTEKRKRPVVEMPPEDRHDDDYSNDFSYQHNNEQRGKLEPFNGPLRDDTSRGNFINNGADFVEEIPPPTDNFVAPKYEEMLLDVKFEEPTITDFLNPDGMKINHKAIRNSSEDVGTTTEDYIPEDSSNITLILGALNDFIVVLDLPIFSDIQKKIEAKLEECKDKKEMIPNNEINLSLELCLSKLSRNHSKPSEGENESMSLKEFLIPFRLAVRTMKCSFLADFDEKLKRMIGELRVQDKNVQITTIRGALQSIILSLLE